MRMRVRLAGCAGVIGLLSASVAIAAPGDIVSGTAKLNISPGAGALPAPFSAPFGDAALFTDANTPDILYKYTWYYRTEIDSRPRLMSALTTPTSTLVGDTATYNYPNTGPGVAGGGGRFDARITVRIESTPDPTQARVLSTMVVKNINPTRRTFKLYLINDIDLPNGLPVPQTDDAVNQVPGAPVLTFRQTEVTSNDFVEFVAPDAAGWLLASGTDVRNALNNTTVNDLGNGLSTFDGDAALAFQWTLTLDPQESRTITTTFAINAPAVAPPACRPDYNGQGGVTVQDIFDFLAGWFSNAPAADFNGQNGVTVQDIFDFLTAWFTGC